MARRSDSIYVEININGPIDRVWRYTQSPELHERWDLRFTEISYLPRPDATQPQRFLYATRIGFGMQIRGQGESAGSCDGPAGERSSALRFWSEDPASLIRDGSGYWKYIPSRNGGETVRFLTRYDYSVRFGALGHVFDKFIFRPLIGWATAWSFDRLRLWIEMDIDPAVSMRQTLIYLIARVSVAFVWCYEGSIPKLIFQQPAELAMLRDAGFSNSAARVMSFGIGWIEVAIGLVILLGWRLLWPIWFTLVAMPIAAVFVAINSPGFIVAPFNPVTLNLSVFALAAISLFAARNLPSANHCLRQPPPGES